MNEKVSEWFNNLPEPQRQKMIELRELILEVDERFSEELKWGQPCYSKNKLVCYLQNAKKHVAIGFQQGAHLEDRSGLLVGEGKDMRHVKYGLTENVGRLAIATLITKAIEFDRC